ncbi:hypothetical protein WA1_11955 [Scytonema hofmannii PCC 7110]|uniref:Uncharacterized protein n=1 Tax=Scytonema hofmannii PCC 7110 TaxID=128403 RepID=A0A139XDV4_9CYAN|nr:hypothetical protein [Scytonema hofmannii]KYC42833.1 hypothetical protein WA1_11955 [Scytonema hofmannii PCC 7110]
MSLLKHLSLVLVIAICFFFALPAYASFCRNDNGHQICIIDIKRSAKNYWEYRAVLNVDGVKRPVEVYNCRDRKKIQKDGTALPFGKNDPGEIVCRLFKKTRSPLAQAVPGLSSANQNSG